MDPGLCKLTTLWIGLLLLMQGCWKENPRIIEVETGKVSGISYTSASVSGMVLDVGESQLEAYGHCWSLSSDPSYDLDNKTHLGRCDTLGTFMSLVSGLLPDTRYYVRSYAKSGDHVVYGNEVSFATLGDAWPEVITTDAFNIDFTSASCGGSITEDWGLEVTARGVCWGTEPLPSTSGAHTTEPGDGASFTSSLEGLTEGESYYYRAYASNSFGTAYGEEKYFDTRLHPPEIAITLESAVTSHSITLQAQASGLLITRKGICFSTEPNPVVDGTETSQAAEEGTFTAYIQGLLSNRTYYLRPYAVNREGTYYGDQIQISTLPMIFNLWVVPDSLYNGCPEDEWGDSPWCHEIYNSDKAVWAEIEGVSGSVIEVGWDGEFNAYREQNLDVREASKGGMIYQVSETQSIVLSFYVGDEDNLTSAEYLDQGSEVFPMSTILDLENAAPTSRYSGSYTLPWDNALNGGCLDFTFHFEFTEQ